MGTQNLVNSDFTNQTYWNKHHWFRSKVKIKEIEVVRIGTDA